MITTSNADSHPDLHNSHTVNGCDNPEHIYLSANYTSISIHFTALDSYVFGCPPLGVYISGTWHPLYLHPYLIFFPYKFTAT